MVKPNLLTDNDHIEHELSRQMDMVLDCIEQQNIDELNIIQRDEILRRLTRTIRHRRWRRYMLMTTAMAAMFVLGLGFHVVVGYVHPSAPSKPEYASLTVAKGEQPVSIVFQDGSRVTVNSGSSLTYPRQFATEHRTVELNGEAYFEIATNKECPFVVNLGTSRVNVTGTSFNVKSYAVDSITTVTLDRGVIDFECDGVRYAVKPSQKLSYNHVRADRPTVTRIQSSDRSSLWREHVLAFDKASMREVLTTINRLYNVDFEIKNPEVYNFTYTYTSENSRQLIALDALLHDLSLISDATFTLTDGKVIVN